MLECEVRYHSIEVIKGYGLSNDTKQSYFNFTRWRVIVKIVQKSPKMERPFTPISAVLKIDWTKCTPNPLKSHEELEGMEIVVYYRLDEDEPTEISHTFKQDEPLQSFFTGPHRSVGRLEVFEDGSVVFKQNG